MIEAYSSPSRLQEGAKPQTEKGAGRAGSPPVPGLLPDADGRLGGLKRDAALLQERHQFLLLEHLAHDIGAADELTLHIKLGDGRPVGESLDALADLWSSSTFTALNLTPIWDRICTVTAEKPHCGKAGVPFIYSSTSLLFTSSAMRVPGRRTSGKTWV